MKFYVIADEDIVLGFRYAGIEGEIVNEPAKALEAFRKAVSLPDVGILMMTEKIADFLDEEVLKWQMESSYPLIVEIPDFDGHLPDRRTLAEAIREAIGINV